MLPKVSIPKPINPTDAKFPPHLKAFHDCLASLGPTLRKLAMAVRGYDIFTTRTLQRSKNLFLGGAVLLLAVQSLPNDAWRVCWLVGKYTGFAKKIHEAELVYKRKAAKIVKEGGHHVVDQMALGGVERRGVQ